MYELVYDKFTGKAICVKRPDGSFMSTEGNSNPDFQDFLKWNSKQKVPLDLNSTIEPAKPEPIRDLAKEIDNLTAKVAEMEKRAVAK